MNEMEDDKLDQILSNKLSLIRLLVCVLAVGNLIYNVKQVGLQKITPDI